MQSSVNYGDTAFSGTIAPDVPIVQPVVDQSGSTFAGTLANGMKDLDSIFSQGIQDQRTKNAKITGSLAGDITQRVNMYADAIDQGMSRAEALTRLRKDTNEWMSNNPGQEANIQEFLNKSIGSTTIAPELAEDTPKEKADKVEAQAAYQMGWSLDPNTPDQAVLANYRQHQVDLQKVADLGTKIDLIQKSGQVVTAPLIAQATMALHGAIASGLPWVQGQIADGMKALDGVTDPAARAQIIAGVESRITTQTALVDQMRTESGNAVDTSYMTDGYKTLLQNFKDVANGTETIAQYKGSDELQTAKIQHNLMLDPATAAAFTISKMSNFADPSVLIQLTSAATKTLQAAKDSGNNILGPNDPGAGTARSPDLVDKSTDTKLAFDYTAGAIKNMNADPSKVDADTTAETNATITGMFKSVAEHSSNGDPTQLNAFMKFMADPNVGSWIETHMKDIAPQVSSDARQIVEQNYQNVGVTLVNERWGAAQALIDKMDPNASADSLSIGRGLPGGAQRIVPVNLTDAITPVWNGSGIEFQVNAAYKNNAVMVNQAKSLTTDVAGPLNNMVRAQAHMEGTRDYQKVYDTEFAKRLWVAGGDVPGSITDLTPPLAADTAKATNAYFDKLKSVESGGNNDAVNPASSATGPYQFTKGTWADLSHKYPDAGLTANGRTDPTQNDVAIKLFTKDNERYLKSEGVPVTDQSRYAAHFLGNPSAVDVFKAPADTPIVDLVPRSTITANPFLKSMTVTDFMSWLDRKF